MYENSVEDIILAQNDDKDAMNRLIKTNIGLIWNIAKRFFR